MLLALAIAAADPTLVEFLSRARISVPDARSISDVQLCPVEPSGRAFVAFSRRGDARAYYALSIRPGRTTRLLDLDLRGNSEGLASLGARAMEKRLTSCRWVPADELAGAWLSIEGPR